MTTPSALRRAIGTVFAGAGLFAVLLATPAMADELADVTKLLRSGKAGEALARTNQFLVSHPSDPQMRFMKGVLLTEQNKSDEAIAIFTRLTEDYKDLPEPYNNLAVLYAASGQYDKARVALEKAIRTNPSYMTAYENLGDVYGKLASQAYDKALALGTTTPPPPSKLTLLRTFSSSTGSKGASSADSQQLASTAAPSAPAPVKLVSPIPEQPKTAPLQRIPSMAVAPQPVSATGPGKAVAPLSPAPTSAPAPALARTMPAAAPTPAAKPPAMPAPAPLSAPTQAPIAVAKPAVSPPVTAAANAAAAAASKSLPAPAPVLAATPPARSFPVTVAAAASAAPVKPLPAPAIASAAALAVSKPAGPGAGVPAAAAAVPPAVKAAASAAIAATAPPAKAETAGPSVGNAERDEVLHRVNAWAKAWAAQDVDGYLGYYSQAFMPPKGLSRQAWADERRARIAGKGRIRVEVNAPQVTITDGTARVTFRQVYESDRLSANSRKTLVMEKHGGKWQIKQESSGG